MAKTSITQNLPVGISTIDHNLYANARDVSFIDENGYNVGIAWKRTTGSESTSIDVNNATGSVLQNIEINIQAW